MTAQFVLAAALAVASFDQQATLEAPGATADTAVLPGSQPVPLTVQPPKLVLPRGTMVRLMVTREVNSRDNHPGDRFALRVDEDVKVHGVTIIPVGAKGWGELTDVSGTGSAGKSGKLSARLLYVEASGQHIELEGERQSAGGGGTGNVIGGVLAFGVFGLFMKGGNASLKAGEILNGYTLADATFDLPAAKP